MPYQARYIAFLRSQGLPDDYDPFDGGTEFILWVEEGRRQFCRETGHCYPFTISVHEEFTDFLFWKAKRERGEEAYED